ncbi:restriction endonuclease subunit S [Pantoea dispersa]|uniref:restriction endonuclease subunit S n=1 Tax=Pantoea dispersa TaxID=59814 RepID=UPI0032B46808
MSDFGTYQLESFSEITSSKRIFYSDYVSSGIPFYRSKEIIELHNNKSISNELFISEEKFLEVSEKFGAPEPGDILLTSVGTLGIPYIVKKGDKFYFKDGNLTWIRKIDRKKVLPEYIYRFLKSPYGKSKLDDITIGSTQPALTISGLKTLTLSIPSLLEQKAITSLLCSLDDKIDLLHRQNKTLESMAETLFRQWFNVDSNEEWQEKNVLDIFTLVGGGTPKTSVAEYWTDEIPWISGGDISSAHQGYLYRTEKSISLAGIQNSSAKLLPKNSTVISARGTVGKYALLARDMAFSQSNYGIVSKIGSYPFFIYLLVGFIVDDLLAAAYGSVFDTITTRTFESVNLKFPSLNSIEKFNKEVASLFNKKEINTSQIKILEKLRDTLLPKLMCGEVRVQYAEEAIASVA